MIQIYDMYKTYQMGDTIVNALNGVNLDIRKNEFVAITGPSGSGKSTLMNMLGCLDVPSSGIYMLDDVEVNELNDDELSEIRNRKIGFIFQGFNLLQKMDALENVELPLMYQGMNAKERLLRAEAALERVGLKERMHHRPTELSGGQQQRVAIARAIAGDPQIILADEPTGNLDTHSGDEIMEIFHELNAKGNTIILITHEMNVAEQAKRLVRIRDGEIVEDRRLMK